LRIASFAPFLGGVSVLAVRNGFIDLASFSLLFWVVLAVAVLALILSAFGLRSLWRTGKRGGRRIIWALICCAIVMTPYAIMANRSFFYPEQADTSTDLVQPPLFLDDLRSIEGDARAIVASQLKDGYPNLEGRRYRADMETLQEAIRAVSADLGLRETERRGRVGANDEIFFEFIWHSPVIRWPHDLVVRMTDEGDTTFVDIRSRAIGKTHDLGANAHMIDAFQSALDFALIGKTS
jgi:hypothetical protein